MSLSTNLELAASIRARCFCPTIIWSFLMLACLVVLALTDYALAQERYHSNPWLLSWIPSACCVTNDCCWEIRERELTPLPDDEWMVLATGQVRKRTNWSPDGKF